MKEFLITLAAVVAGIWLYSRLRRDGRRAMKMVGDVTTKGGDVLFSGLRPDPVTGANLPPGAMAGTVEFSAQIPS